LILAREAVANPVTLQWEPNPEANIAGYFLHYGNAPRQYIHQQEVTPDACDAETCTVSLDLPDGVWFFAATAFDIYGVQSDYSEEIHAALGTEEPVLLYPNGAITWVRGCQYQIVWDNLPEKSVKLELLKDGGAYRKIASKTKNDGELLWRVHKKAGPGEGFQVRVSAGGQAVESGEPFRIVVPTVSHPNASTSVSRGDSCSILWERDTFCGTSVSIVLTKGRKAVLEIAEITPNTGSFEWHVPSDLTPGSKYRIQVQSKIKGACRSYSPGSFTIQ
jgi:hypothetical protein